MPKTLTSPVAHFSGTVTLSDPMTFPQFQAWAEAARAAREILAAQGKQSDFDRALLPGLCACVATWELSGLPQVVTPDTFPATPRQASSQLIGWLHGEISAIVRGDEEAPKA